MIHRSALREFPTTKNFQSGNTNQNFRSAFTNTLNRKLTNADQWMRSARFLLFTVYHFMKPIFCFFLFLVSRNSSLLLPFPLPRKQFPNNSHIPFLILKDTYSTVLLNLMVRGPWHQQVTIQVRLSYDHFQTIPLDCQCH